MRQQLEKLFPVEQLEVSLNYCTVHTLIFIVLLQLLSYSIIVWMCGRVIMKSDNANILASTIMNKLTENNGLC